MKFSQRFASLLPTLFLFFGAIILIDANAYSTAAQNSNPPKAAVKPTVLENHGVTRTDNYYWLRERENQEVIDYLN